MHVIIRRATSFDAVVTAELYLRARRAGAAAGTIPPLAHDDDEVRNWIRDVVIERLECWLAERGSGALIGMLALAADWIDRLYVDPDTTGVGIGAELIAVAKRERPDADSEAGPARHSGRPGFSSVTHDSRPSSKTRPRSSPASLLPRRLGEFEENVRFVTDDPAVMTRIDDRDVPGTKLQLGPVVHANALAAGEEDLDVTSLAALAADGWFDVR
jgi:GNAT superfamily N-acetyltransferase